ncbi:hypothetical protein KAJ27_16470, partial [bacterium]|nr:hypothetical protein [bacterium]
TGSVSSVKGSVDSSVNDFDGKDGVSLRSSSSRYAYAAIPIPPIIVFNRGLSFKQPASTGIMSAIIISDINVE